MTLVLRRIKVYLKLLAILLSIVLKNLDRTVNVWFFGEYEGINVLWLILITAVSAIVGWWGFLKVFGVLRELREVRAATEANRRLEAQRQFAEEMALRERRIDEKVKRSISGPGA